MHNPTPWWLWVWFGFCGLIGFGLIGFGIWAVIRALDILASHH